MIPKNMNALANTAYAPTQPSHVAAAATAKDATPRFTGIDVGRYTAALFIAFLHVGHDVTFTMLHLPPIEPPAGNFSVSLGDVITQLSRFAVPFFF